MKRVVITGQSGTGKTRLANIVSELTNIPKTHIDRIRADTPGDQPRPKEYVNAQIEKIVANDEWIIEGAYFQGYDNMMTRIDHFLVLDFGKFTRFRRVFMRMYKSKGFFRVMFPHEKRVFHGYWLLKRILLKECNLDDYYLKLLNEAPDHVMCFHLNSNADVEKFIRYTKMKNQQRRNT